MSKELYVVNMNWEPHFLDPLVVVASPTQGQRSYDEYAAKLGGKVPKLFPLAALFKDHERFGDACIVPDQFGQTPYGIEDSQINGQPLHEGLAKILTGEGHSAGPIDLIVEFSGSPLYHQAIDKLAGQYKITKIQIE